MTRHCYFKLDGMSYRLDEHIYYEAKYSIANRDP